MFCHYFSIRKYFYTFYSQKSSKRAKEHKSTAMTPYISTGIKVQSPQSDSTLRRLTLVYIKKIVAVSICTWFLKYQFGSLLQTQKNQFRNKLDFLLSLNFIFTAWAGTYLQLPLRKWGAGNVYLLVLSTWKVNIAENPIAVMGL